MPDILPCGHPVAAYIDHPGWGWCGQCAQQAEAALPPPRPSRLVPDTTDLHAAIAQRLFGWTWLPQTEIWMGRPCPAYTTDPAATALVWQWLEGHRMEDLSFHYDRPGEVGCQLSYTSQANDYQYVYQTGTTWTEALCRAALALAAAMDTAPDAGEEE